MTKGPRATPSPMTRVPPILIRGVVSPTSASATILSLPWAVVSPTLPLSAVVSPTRFIIVVSPTWFPTVVSPTWFTIVVSPTLLVVVSPTQLPVIVLVPSTGSFPSWTWAPGSLSILIVTLGVSVLSILLVPHELLVPLP